MNPKEIRHMMIDANINQKCLALASGYSVRSINRFLNRETIPDRTGFALLRAVKEFSERGHCEA